MASTYTLIHSIKDQQAHQQHTDFLEEYRRMLSDARIKYADRYIA